MRDIRYFLAFLLNVFILTLPKCHTASGQLFVTLPKTTHEVKTDAWRNYNVDATRPSKTKQKNLKIKN